jgi:hypothetical protein
LGAGNPYFSQMASNVANTVVPLLNSQWEGSGRFTGNSEAPRAIGKGLSDAIGGLAYNNYTAERGNQFNAAGMAPQMDQAQYIDPQMLMSIGGMQRGMSQANINDAIYRALYSQNQPSAALDTELQRLMGLGNMGNTGHSDVASSPSLMQSLLGGGLMGASALGQGGGGLGSLFSSAGSGLGSIFSGIGSGLGSIGGGLMDMLPWATMAL